MKFTSFSSTVHWLIVHVKQWGCCVVWNPNSLLPTCVRPTAQTLNSVWLLHLWSDVGTSLSHTNTGQWADLWQVMSTSASFQLNVVDEAVDRWQKRLDACVSAQGGHFRQCFDIACRLFHDCIKCVNWVTFLTSYCCKLLLVLQISQGSVVTVLRQGGLN